MNTILLIMGLTGFVGLVVTTVYETWLGVSLREPSMTRIMFGANVTMKLLLIATLSYILYAIHSMDALLIVYHGHEVREYIRFVLYSSLVIQVLGVAVALFRWDRRAVRISQERAESVLVERQKELHDKLDKRGIQ